MNELKKHLEAGDPLLRERGLSTADIERMRRVVLGSGGFTSPMRWSGVIVALACWLVIVVGASVWTVRGALTTGSAAHSVAGPAEVARETTGRRQVQFSTPGGTRVIWVLETSSN
jgi:hypothetical protein